MKKNLAKFLLMVFVIVSIGKLGSIKVMAASTGIPARLTIQHDNFDGDGNYKITMNIWWGNNGTIFKLYENDTLVNTQNLADSSPNAQSVTVELKNKPKGSYIYRCELINSFGTSLSTPITVNVTIGQDALPEPIKNEPFDGTIISKIDFENYDNANSNLGGQATTFAIEKAEGRNNSKCLSISSNIEVKSTWYNYLPVKVGKVYKVSAYVKGENLAGRGTLNLQNEEVFGYIENSTEWRKVTFISKINSEYNPFLFVSLGENGSLAKGKIYLDDIEVTEYPEYDDLERGLTSWTNNTKIGTTYNLESTTGLGNSKALSINSTSYQDGKWIKKINLDTDKSYRLSAKVKLENVVSQVDLGAYIKANGIISSKVNSTGNSDFKDIYVDFKIPKDIVSTKEVVINLGLGDENSLAKGKVIFDDIKILESDQVVEEPTKKLITKIDFESGENSGSNFGGGAIYSIENLGGLDNSKCLSISSNTDVDASWYRYIPTVPGKSYRITAKIKTENLKGRVIMAFDGKYTFTESTNGEWKTVSFISEAKEKDGFLFCNLGGWGQLALGKVYFDNITIEEYENVVVFDDFEAENNQWKNSAENGVKYTVENTGGINNSKCLSISTEDYKLGAWKQLFKLKPGKYYKVYANIKVENVISKGELGGILGTFDCISSEGYQSTYSGGWKKKEMSFLVKEEETSDTEIQLNLGYYNRNQVAKGKVYFDNILIVEETNMAINSSKHFKTIFEKEDLSYITNENMSIWLSKMDSVYEKLSEFSGGTPFNGKYLTIESIKGAETVGGLYVIGNPYIYWPQVYIKNSMKNINQGDSSFGVMHEIGHQFALGNGSWRWINDEMFANFRMFYAVENLNLDVIINDKTYKGAELSSFYKIDGSSSYVNTFGNINNPKFSADGLMWKLLEIKNTIGWQPFIDTFKELSSKESLKSTNFDKFQEFIEVLDSKTNQDVRAMFNDNEWSIIKNQINSAV